MTLLSTIFDLFIRFIGVEPDPEERPDDLPPGFAPLLPDGCRLVQLPNGRFHVAFPCGEELRTSSGEGWTIGEAQRACAAVIGEAKRRREFEQTEGR